ncbi:hypothetical protein B0H11DRAFT_1002151 [Mycena galericulata]|nr:hypothetical protein B0H11DRAFT_1002151 [Mycena galericulata]
MIRYLLTEAIRCQISAHLYLCKSESSALEVLVCTMASLAQLTVRTPDAAARPYFDAMHRAVVDTIWLEDLDRGTRRLRDGHTQRSTALSHSFLYTTPTEKPLRRDHSCTPAHQLFSAGPGSLTTSSALLRRFTYPCATFLLRTSKTVPTEDGVDELAPRTWLPSVT